MAAHPASPYRQRKRTSPFEEQHVAFLNLLMMCRAQFAVERSYQRLVDANPTGPGAGMEAVLGPMLEAHAFLVSADLAWDALKELKQKLAFPALDAAMTRHMGTRSALTKAQNHI